MNELAELGAFGNDVGFPEPEIAGRSRLILVVGMHRSGMSAVTRALSLCGASLPRDLIEPASDNPVGFWEGRQIFDIHEDIFRSVGSSWTDMKGLPPHWFASEEAALFRYRLGRAIDPDLSSVHPLLVKDRRLWRLLPLWKQLCAEREIDVRFVLPVRHPLEIAESLDTGSPTATAEALLLWLRHVLEVERETRGLDRCFISYDQFVQDTPRAIARVVQRLKIVPHAGADATAVAGVIDQGHVDHRRPEKDLACAPFVSDWIRAAHEWLRQAAADTSPDPTVIDEIAAALHAADLTFGPLLTAHASYDVPQSAGEAGTPPAIGKFVAAFLAHQGNLSDKWEQYLGVYEAELQRFVAARQPIRLLEIGIQNGGSLQLWSRYLPAESSVTGIDIDDRCVRLTTDRTVRVLIGDASNPDVLARLLGDQEFDVIIDDGSHRSVDMIATFEACFDRLRPGGLYFVEDLHCSYRPEFGGGFRQRGAALEWFKLLVDALHADHIEDSAVADAERERLMAYNRAIARIEFFDSIMVIERLQAPKTAPYRRIFAGRDMPVEDVRSALLRMPPAAIRNLVLAPSAADIFSPAMVEALASAREEAGALRVRLEHAVTEAAHVAAAAEPADATAEAVAAKAEHAEAQFRQTAAALAAAEAALAAAEAALAEAEVGRARAESDVSAARQQAAAAAHEAEVYRANRDSLLASTSWRITAPLRGLSEVMRHGPTALRRQPGRPSAAANGGGSQLPRRLADIGAAAMKRLPPQFASKSEVPTLVQAVSQRFSALQPLCLLPARDEGRRVTIVTDSINAGSLFGGVATALILATLMARRLGAKLRLVTRTEPAEVANFATVLATHRIDYGDNIEFVHAPPGSMQEIPSSDREIMLTTSWWTTRTVRPVMRPERIVYLLQEDERMFYPNGDDRLRCAETLADPNLHFVINSRMLFEHFVNGPEPLPNIRARGVWFEPAFPAFDRPAERAPRNGGKRRFFFYARPTNLRNLYWRGLEAIGACLEEGILDPAEWEFHFAGRDLSDVELPRGVRPLLSQNLPWPEYVKLVQSVDVGLSLMDTPHPSYPPLDLAASGALVVTNRYGGKTSLTQYSGNIICAEPTIDGLKRGIHEAVRRAKDPQRRPAPDHLQRNWEQTLAPVLEHLFPGV